MKTKEWTDPIVDEVHKIRKQMAEEAGNDLAKLVSRLQQAQKLHEGRIVSRQADTA